LERRFTARWTSRALIVALLFGSGVPVLSALVAPLMVATLAWTYGRAFARDT
jgi:hypothetical protein